MPVRSPIKFLSNFVTAIGLLYVFGYLNLKNSLLSNLPTPPLGFPTGRLPSVS